MKGEFNKDKAPKNHTEALEMKSFLSQI
jgi:hypothetical protein